MIVDRIGYQGTFPIGDQGHYDKPWMEAAISPTEDPVQSLHALKKLCVDFIHESNGIPKVVDIKPTEQRAFIIDKNDERVEIDIDNIQSMEQYNEFVASHPALKSKHITQLNTKRQNLKT